MPSTCETGEPERFAKSINAARDNMAMGSAEAHRTSTTTQKRSSRIEAIPNGLGTVKRPYSGGRALRPRCHRGADTCIRLLSR